MTRLTTSCAILIPLIFCHGVASSSSAFPEDEQWSKVNGVFEKESTPWIDPETPESARKTMSHGMEDYFKDDTSHEFDLVFSDEFNAEGRTMHDGRDPRWTALNQDDLTNNPLHWYSHDAVKTSNGMLNIKLDIHPQTFQYTRPGNHKRKADYVNVTKEFRTGMVQSWNKFCFIGGIIEISAKLPGDPRTGGLWPASE
jgi:beta-glucanase (GH16 family)